MTDHFLRTTVPVSPYEQVDKIEAHFYSCDIFTHYVVLYQYLVSNILVLINHYFINVGWYSLYMKEIRHTLLHFKAHLIIK